MFLPNWAYCPYSLTTMSSHQSSTLLFCALLVLCLATGVLDLFPISSANLNKASTTPNCTVQLVETFKKNFSPTSARNMLSSLTYPSKMIPIINLNPISGQKLYPNHFNAFSENQSLIDSGECRYMSDPEISTLNQCYLQIAQMGVCKMELCSAQVGVNVDICFLHVAVFQSSEDFLPVKILKTLLTNIYQSIQYISYKAFQLHLSYLRLFFTWNSAFHSHPSDFHIIYYSFQAHKSVYKTCKMVSIFLMRSFCSRHDFKIYLLTIHCIYLVTTIFILGHCSLQFWIVLQSSFNNYDVSLSSNVHNYNIVSSPDKYLGGGRMPIFTYDQLQEYITSSFEEQYNSKNTFKFVCHCPKSTAETICNERVNCISGSVPLNIFVPTLIARDIQNISKLHNVHISYRANVSQLLELLSNHHCSYCETYVSIFEHHSVQSIAERSKTWYNRLHKKPDLHNKSHQAKKVLRSPNFPPLPPSLHLQETIICTH